jgi:transcription initiation factor IIE alpha subunit
MPFGKYLEAREMLKQSEQSEQSEVPFAEDARPVDLLALLSKDQDVTLSELSERTGLTTEELRARLDPLVEAGLVAYTKVEDEDAARPTDTGAAAL